jgi:ABC-type nitrate/sulfonate/bicarbonate transport system permease component
VATHPLRRIGGGVKGQNVEPTVVAGAALETLVETESPAGDTAPPRVKSKMWMISLASVIAFHGMWEIVGRRVSPLFLSYPTAIVKAGVAMTLSGELGGALASSIRTLLAGFVTAALIGIVMGLLIGRYKIVDAATEWIINAMYATPLVAVIPLVILWLGLGDAAKLFIVTILAVFPVLINTSAGVRNVPQALIDVSTAFAANERQVFVKIILPASVPYMMTGLRLGIGRAIIGMVVSEFFTAITGLGAVIVKYGNQYDTASMFVPIYVLMLLGVSLTALVRRVEEKFAPWRHVD